jgi:hypothetical protein
VAAVLVRDAMAAATVDTTRRVLQVLMAEAAVAAAVVDLVFLVALAVRELLSCVTRCRVFRRQILMLPMT